VLDPSTVPKHFAHEPVTRLPARSIFDLERLGDRLLILGQEPVRPRGRGAMERGTNEKKVMQSPCQWRSGAFCFDLYRFLQNTQHGQPSKDLYVAQAYQSFL